MADLLADEKLALRSKTGVKKLEKEPTPPF
jgi:hypothetical protein